MRNKLHLLALMVCIFILSPQLASGAEEIVVENAAVCNLRLGTASNAIATNDNASVSEENNSLSTLSAAQVTEILIMLGNELIVDNASAVWNLMLENVTSIGILPPPYEPGVMVTKYADAFTYLTLENATSIGILPPPYEPGVMVTRYADAFMYAGLEVPPFSINITEYFDTGEGTHPSISGTHSGTIEPSSDMLVTKLYTYACSGTGGHSKSIALYENGALVTSGMWKGYGSDWHNITLTPEVTLQAGHTYNYTLVTGSYPQIIHASGKGVTGGTITCTGFEDANGRKYENWIPAIKLY